MSRIRKMTFVGIIFVLVLIATYLFIPSAEKQIELKTTFLEFEYGSVFTITKNDLFDEDVQFEDFENANLVKADQLFAEVGIHPVMINYKFKDKEYEQLIDVSIVDRTRPTVEMLRVKLVTPVNTPLKDYEQFIVASDLSPFEINFDDSQVNYNVKCQPFSGHSSI